MYSTIGLKFVNLITFSSFEGIMTDKLITDKKDKIKKPPENSMKTSYLFTHFLSRWLKSLDNFHHVAFFSIHLFSLLHTSFPSYMSSPLYFCGLSLPFMDAGDKARIYPAVFFVLFPHVTVCGMIAALCV